ncbi:alginate lyase family protein [bacterium]|nr:alginate lyase family protein [bacterium]
MSDQQKHGNGAKPPSGHGIRTLLLVPELLADARSRAQRHALAPPEADGLRALVAEADASLPVQPPSVMDKKHTPPTGDKHDYFSLGIYLWPNPGTPDKLPYVSRDGEINPEVADYDRPGMLRMHRAVEALALAWAFTGDERYAAKAAAFLRVWFTDPATRMNPNMLFAQYIPGSGGFRTAFPPRWVEGRDGKGVYVSFGGVIEGSSLPLLFDVVEMLKSSTAWTAHDDELLRGWAREFMQWLLTHQHGKDEAGCPNNHAVWYCVQIASYALLCGDLEVARDILENRVPSLMSRQIEPDGSMPHEVSRAVGLHYVLFTLNAFANLALMGERIGVDLWRCRTADGRSLKAAIDWAVPYLAGEPWPYRPFVKPFDFATGIPLLAAAAHRLREQRYADARARVPRAEGTGVMALLYPSMVL